MLPHLSTCDRDSAGRDSKDDKLLLVLKELLRLGACPGGLDLVPRASTSSHCMTTFWQTPSSKWLVSPFTNGGQDSCSVSLTHQLPKHVCSRGQTHPTLYRGRTRE